MEKYWVKQILVLGPNNGGLVAMRKLLGVDGPWLLIVPHAHSCWGTK